MVQVDRTFLYGKYTQTLLIASSQDGNSNVVPLAFTIVEGETLEAWTWFLKRVRLHVVGDRQNICLISDRHPSILSAVSDPRTMWQPPYGHHVFCIRHLASNLNKKYNDSNLKNLFINIDLHRMTVPRQTIINPGPEDPSLLTLQKKHISEHVWQEYSERVLRCRRSSKDHPRLPPPQILQVLKNTGFYGVSRLRYFEFDNALDVAILLGLPCVGVPVVGQTGVQWAEVCLGLLGHTPPEGKLRGQRLSMKWLNETFSFANFPLNPTNDDIEHFARAYILKLIGGYLMPDKSSKEVYLMYLPLLADLTAVRTFSWGSAVLAYLYRELCNATDPDTHDISGCMVLLHLWAWERFPALAPHEPHFVDPQVNIFRDLPPLGYRWTCIDVHYHPRYDTLKKYRLLLDSLKEDQIKWRPYDEDHVSQQIPYYCIDNRDIWRANVPLICFHIVEWQCSDRVLRQFGMDQPILENPVDIDFLHTLILAGKTSVDWFREHQNYIQVWNHWEARVAFAPPYHGVPVVGKTGVQWVEVCLGLLGRTPPEGKLRGQRLSMKWLDETFSFANFPLNPTNDDIEHFARAYILKLIGGYLMPDKSSKEVYLMYLPLLADLTAVRTFSWGSAVLAYLFHALAPHEPHFVDPQVNIFRDLPPLGYRWTCIDVHYHPRYDTLKKYRLLLDSLKEDQIKWRPYDEDHVSQQIPYYCIDNRDIWRANVPLICFHIVEWQCSDRVLRQFGMDQPILENPVDIDFLHTLILAGKTSVDWFREHQNYIQVWNHSEARVAFAPPYHGILNRTSEYMKWYLKHSRRWIDVNGATSGYLALLIQERNITGPTRPI
ncbi:serine/threonine-protein phosphatase 7 long form-like protein [Senna tora]|uniref:Serine/threonine-protein phosphatase 7 long form-like protein n=1 Tax=Senna tora TaxID=362788 RepID=A0A834SN76_9FABA|nr:serine/threonine-protein phosphatase 7 long form-like protein [Senna tora]